MNILKDRYFMISLFLMLLFLDLIIETTMAYDSKTVWLFSTFYIGNYFYHSPITVLVCIASVILFSGFAVFTSFTFLDAVINYPTEYGLTEMPTISFPSMALPRIRRTITKRVRRKDFTISQSMIGKEKGIYNVVE